MLFASRLALSQAVTVLQQSGLKGKATTGSSMLACRKNTGQAVTMSQLQGCMLLAGSVTLSQAVVMLDNKSSTGKGFTKRACLQEGGGPGSCQLLLQLGQALCPAELAPQHVTGVVHLARGVKGGLAISLKLPFALFLLLQAPIALRVLQVCMCAHPGV